MKNGLGMEWVVLGGVSAVLVVVLVGLEKQVLGDCIRRGVGSRKGAEKELGGEKKRAKRIPTWANRLKIEERSPD